jgi:hypothetical protein
MASTLYQVTVVTPDPLPLDPTTALSAAFAPKMDNLYQPPGSGRNLAVIGH